MITNDANSTQKSEQDNNNVCAAEGILLDKSRFDIQLKLLAIQIPQQHCSAVTRILNGYLLNRPRVKPVVQDSENEGVRLILLSEDIRDLGLSEIPSERLDAVRRLCAIEIVQHSLVLGYTYWTVDYILKEILPAGVEVPSSFETIGHIAHLNICGELLPYKHTIAQVIFEKNQPKIKTVVNKVGTISNEFRVPTFEVLAGEDNLVTEVKQYGATFRLDYGLVYWNSRLEHEHKRLVSWFHPGELICDMFAGVGPFSIPAAKKGCFVYANDLNPNSVKYLDVNAKLNSVLKNISIFNMDARDFLSGLLSKTNSDKIPNQPTACESSQISHLHKDGIQLDDRSNTIKANTKEDAQKQPSKRRKRKDKEHGDAAVDDISKTKPWEHVDHIVMNLPASALDFLDVFQKFFSRDDWKGSMPWIHCYCFMRSNETEDTILQYAEARLGAKIEAPIVHKVRDVAPNKEMLCLSFKLPESAAFKDDVARHEGFPTGQPDRGLGFCECLQNPVDLTSSHGGK